MKELADHSRVEEKENSKEFFYLLSIGPQVQRSVNGQSSRESLGPLHYVELRERRQLEVRRQWILHALG